MRHVVGAAYMDAIRGLRAKMAQHMRGGDVEPGEEGPEGSPQEESAESPAEEKMEGDSAGGGLTDEEKRESMYPKRKGPGKSALMIAIGVGKKPGGHPYGKHGSKK